jgi:hydroxyacylglutathione hydrolase
MRVEITRLGDNYIYVLAGKDSCAAVDPSLAAPVLRLAGLMGLRLEQVLVTHHHADHTGGCSELRLETNCKIVGPRGAFGFSVDNLASAGVQIMVAGVEFTVLSVPGHTAEDVAYYSEAEKMVFTGDTLFIGGCGKLFGGTAAMMWDAMKMLRGLPDDTEVYCGHEYTVENLEFAASLEPGNASVADRLDEMRRLSEENIPTVPGLMGVERQTNPFLRADDQGLAELVGLSADDPVEVFAEIRRRKNRY